MSLGQSLLPEFDHEMSGTRKTLERLPEAISEWTPHPKSMPLRKLASHVAGLVHWGSLIVDSAELDLRPPGGPGYKPPVHETRVALLDAFARDRQDARRAVESAPDSCWQETWILRAGAHVILSLPKIAVYRSMMMNHLIHHRAQLLVYLRLLDIPIPGLYGPSADES